MASAGVTDSINYDTGLNNGVKDGAIGMPLSTVETNGSTSYTVTYS